MNRLRYINKKMILCIVAGLLLVQWVGVTHTHDSEIDVDRICSICLVGEQLSHGVITAKLTLNLNGVFANKDTSFIVQYPQVSVSYYHSRAPPVYL